jgi:hypothetical protein
MESARSNALDVVSRLHKGLSTGGTVETRLGDRLIGQTYLSLLGSEQTVWQSGCTPAQAALHCRTVNLSVASRIALMDMLATAIRAAIRASTMLAVPGGPILMVPSLVRYLTTPRAPA